MNKLFIVLLGLVLMMSGCREDPISLEEQLVLDTIIIEDYLADNSINASKTASGLHYIITKTGVGSNPEINDEVLVYYKGYLTDGTIFDETSPSSPLLFYLESVIEGWQEGIPLMKKEGKATLFVPSYLGYGTNASGLIPANSVLIFEVELLDF